MDKFVFFNVNTGALLGEVHFDKVGDSWFDTPLTFIREGFAYLLSTGPTDYADDSDDEDEPKGNGQLIIIDLNQMKLVKTLELSKDPSKLTFSDGKAIVHYKNGDTESTAIDLKSHEIVK